jgi:VanZ family protein
MRAFLIYHLPVLAYGTIILAVSSMPQTHVPELRFLAGDKLAHFLEYALFAVLVHRSMRRLTADGPAVRPLLLSVLFLVIFAAGDEYVQKFSPGRHSDILDFLADVIGGTLVVLALWVRHRRQLAVSL